ncbi:hypothetical protein CEXT_646761 [Caerostris extrusa]|uniref:Uncharacterized protein n=1 Tax=Caerostris extrusa TaxID=172846 RepID=A0AAV4XKZ7_CAEEX|nr:hypothetical protein CEXT_646761 [Caerostris extrusa]
MTRFGKAIPVDISPRSPMTARSSKSDRNRRLNCTLLLRNKLFYLQSAFRRLFQSRFMNGKRISSLCSIYPETHSRHAILVFQRNT